MTISASQNEGAYLTDGKGLSNWDVFAKRVGKIKSVAKPSVANDFYYRFKDDFIGIQNYFAWTLTDNFEWSEGFEAKFGLTHVDINTQSRTIKDSGYWFRDFLKT